MHVAMLHAAERQRELVPEEEFSVSLMKRIGDNPHDQHLGVEIAEGLGEIFSELTGRTASSNGI